MARTPWCLGGSHAASIYVTADMQHGIGKIDVLHVQS